MAGVGKPVHCRGLDRHEGLEPEDTGFARGPGQVDQHGQLGLQIVGHDQHLVHPRLFPDLADHLRVQTLSRRLDYHCDVLKQEVTSLSDLRRLTCIRE